MQMRLLFAALLATLSFACGDDADEHDGGVRDAGSDAASGGPPDADAPELDGRVADGSDQDASDAADAGHDGGDAGPCLESSYIWAQVEECFGSSAPQPIARRVTLLEFCDDYGCPADWAAALAAAADCDEQGDAGSDACWAASMECRANLLRATRNHDGRFLHYDPATGELLGAAIQLSDAAEDCVVSEIIAGERPPVCCEDPDGG